MKFTDKELQKFEKLGKNIQKYREGKEITLKELSEKTGIRKEYLQKIEKGIAYGVLIERHLFKIASALNIKVSDMFDI